LRSRVINEISRAELDPKHLSPTKKPTFTEQSNSIKKMKPHRCFPNPTTTTKARAMGLAALAGLLAVPSNGALIAYYDFENDTQDSSGNNNHGTNNGVTFSTTVASSLTHSTRSGSFEGGTSGDHVDLGYLNLFGIAQSTGLTISLWVRPNVESQGAWVIAEGNDTDPDTAYVMGARTQAVGKFSNFVRNNGGTFVTNASSQNAFVVGEWHHVLITDNAGTVTVYIDGVQDPNNLSYAKTGTYTFQNSSIGAWLRGAAGGNPTINNQFDGLIDDVAIYNEILGASRIAALAGGANPIPEPSAALLSTLAALGFAGRRSRK
jgi:hypothetical protein